jgi:hypothetical protein
MLEGQIVLPLHAMEAYVRRRVPAPLIINLSAGCRQTVNYRNLLLCARQVKPVSIE